MGFTRTHFTVGQKIVFCYPDTETHLYPLKGKGVVKAVYPKFFVVDTGRYLTTIHYSDIITGRVNYKILAKGDKV